MLDPIPAPTTDGKALAKILLNKLTEYDQGLSRPMLHSITRYNLGDQICEWLEIPLERPWNSR